MSTPNSPSGIFAMDEDELRPRSPLDEGEAREGGPEAPGGGEAAPPPEKKRRVIRNPMPKLNPDRICGPRGIGILPSVMADFQPKGKGREFEDLNLVLKKLEHWAHRLYPKLPFDDVSDRLTVLGKKMAVKTYLKKLRMGIVEETVPKDDDGDDNNPGNDLDEAQRYEDDENPQAGPSIPNENDIFDNVFPSIQSQPSFNVPSKDDVPDSDEEQDLLASVGLIYGEDPQSSNVGPDARSTSPVIQEKHLINPVMDEGGDDAPTGSSPSPSSIMARIKKMMRTTYG
ncbi:TIMELESS-interacting protein-like [Tigriopus californicus]|uniref:TIMELESS-interacting protein-like n=1 Tax=Tigriopus californicus TaxID=6832 RepID=UPI0027DA8445|nr:TIMELESS-interacting protein-like [Tigriopus californicus]